MKILFTGASSFTGYAFVQELASKGHEVWATFTVSDTESYTGIRGERVKRLQKCCKPVWDCRFGDEKFLSLINKNGPWDILCHHAADVTNYKSLDFDIGSALSENTKNSKLILEELLNHGCNNIALTGSAFEQNEGLGELPLMAFSPYGLSKGLTTEVFQFWCQQLDIVMGKFVIPNPFGPYEEPRFTSYLANTWLRDDTAGVNTPLYVRDNIHISLLAISYVDFVEKLHNSNTSIKHNPSGYIESQGAFATRFSNEMSKRFNFPCKLEIGEQTDFSEPMVRINSDNAGQQHPQWDEEKAWDSIANFYLSRNK